MGIFADVAHLSDQAHERMSSPRIPRMIGGFTMLRLFPTDAYQWHDERLSPLDDPTDSLRQIDKKTNLVIVQDEGGCQAFRYSDWLIGQSPLMQGEGKKKLIWPVFHIVRRD